jgi:hypothetical protein
LKILGKGYSPVKKKERKRKVDVIFHKFPGESPVNRFEPKLVWSDELVDVIKCSKFHRDRLSGFCATVGENSPFPVGKR